MHFENVYHVDHSITLNRVLTVFMFNCSNYNIEFLLEKNKVFSHKNRLPDGLFKFVLLFKVVGEEKENTYGLEKTTIKLAQIHYQIHNL